jgi:twitching motility protein PilT
MTTHHPLLERLLDHLAAAGGSDLHIKSGSPAKMRSAGEIVRIPDTVVDAAAMEEIARLLAGEEGFAALEAGRRGIDTYYRSRAGRRYRVNLFLHLRGMAAVLRAIAESCIPLEELGLPAAVTEFTELSRGLVLVTGSTGSGKSTTLAAMIDRINRNERKHIITIEDPIEFMHADAKALIEQRNIGEHVEDFASALKDALREDPDIILVGEMRDIETIRMALHAANTGHLVFSTLHTLDAKETVSRVIGVFPAGEQNQIRMALASVLRGVVSQRLIKGCDGRLSAAVEVMRATERVRQLIIGRREHELLDVIEEGNGVHGMQSFDQALLTLVREGRIDRKQALSNATRPADLAILLQRYCGDGGGDVIPLKESEPLPECTPEPETVEEPPVRVNLLKSIRIR